VQKVSLKKILVRLKPGVPKRYLLLVAAFIWLVAGGILIYRGEELLPGLDHFFWGMVSVLTGGLLMFLLFFLRLSIKLIKRITSMEILKPCVFSFFDLKGYFMMAIMISLGIILRRSGIISMELLAYFYFTMSIPLLLSSIRFFIAWKKYPLITGTY
jgi:hypothetical protein